MKLTMLALAAIALVPSLASAHGRHHHRHVRPVQAMTCAQAQAMVDAHGRYYKDTGLGDVVPMYPVFSEVPSCDGYGYGSSVGRLNYIFEPTLDNPSCFLGFRCANR